MREAKMVLLLSWALLIAAIGGAIALPAKADPQPPFDRALVERLVRAEEDQVRELRALRTAVEQAGRR